MNELTQLEFSFIDQGISYLFRLDKEPEPFLLRSWLRLACFQELGQEEN